MRLAYEPEAAAVYCKQLPKDHMVGKDDPVKFTPNQSYVVVDLGGTYIHMYISIWPTGWGQSEKIRISHTSCNIVNTPFIAKFYRFKEVF